MPSSFAGDFLCDLGEVAVSADFQTGVHDSSFKHLTPVFRNL